MKKTLTTVTLGALLSLVAASSFAQAADPAATPGIDKRQAKQEQRIDKGVASGELTRRETRKLERQQGRIEKAETQAKSDGTVSKAERAKLHHMQDHASGNIYRKKHNAREAGAAKAS